MAMNVRSLLPRLLAVAVVAVAALALSVAQGSAAPGLRDVTVLIIRHAEKPAEGKALNTQGEQRAAAYADYFSALQLDGEPLTPQRLIATADSAQSIRPRQTLIPLSHRLQLPIEQPFVNNAVGELVKQLRQTNQARIVLIAWHHKHIDKLISAFGGDPATLMGQPKWPDPVYDWLIVLRFDDKGRLITSRSEKVLEDLMPGDGSPLPGS